MKPNHLSARPHSTRHRYTVLGVVAALLCLALAPSVALAGNSPAEPVPSDRWGNPQAMRPWEIVGDSTHYDGRTVPRAETPIWFDIAHLGNHLYTATGKGVMVHGLDDPKSPALLGQAYGPQSQPVWFESDLKFYIKEVAVAPGNQNVFATGGAGQGVVIWDAKLSGSGASPRVLVQDYQHGADSSELWAGMIGNRNWLFSASNTHGVTVYDLDAATSHSYCDTASGGCSDVYAGSIPAASPRSVEGAGNYLAVALGRDGIEIWNVTNPRSPVKVLSEIPEGLNVSEVSLWQQGGSYFLAAIDATKVDGDYYTHLYDVSCITNATCGITRPLASPFESLGSNGFLVSKIGESQYDGRTYLYVSHLDRFAYGDQREFVWDVTDPYKPLEMTPDNPEGKGYWGWYYARNETGFQNFAPITAVIVDGYIYRAAWTVMDVHEMLGASPPVANFDWSPDPVYAGQQVQLVDQSGGAPTSWLWGFSGASPSKSESTVQNPKVTFGSIGIANVTLSAANDAGFGDPVTKSFQVLDPAPTLTGVGASPTSALICQQVAFEAQGVKGLEPLSYSWVVKDGSGAEVTTGSGAPTFAWDTSTASAGSYTAEVTVSNASGSQTETSPTVTLTAPSSLAITSLGNDPFDFGSVQFRATTEGAASWTWSFGDGTGDKTFTQQSEGENPSHSYTQTGTYTVTLTVENCIHGAVSEAITIEVVNIDPLEISKFEAVSQCQVGGQVGGCFQVGEPVIFDQSISGSPSTYEYDWDGNGTWDETSSSPVTSHTYATDGKYVPKVRVTRGAEVLTVANGCTSAQTGCTGTEIVVGAAQPPAITITGPGSGEVNQSLSFFASASNCSPSSSWSWTAGGGGSVSGSGSQVTVRWSSAGSKSLTVTNTGCSGATGSKFVSISSGDTGGSDPGGGGSTPVAGYSYSPSSPTAGQTVTFDGSPSTGSPTHYTWDFDDGATATGKKVTHTFASAGFYQVKLTISAPGDCPAQVGGLSGICTDAEVKRVTVQPGSSVSASFDDDVDCGGGQVGGGICTVDTGVAVAFTDTSTGSINRRTWDFGDGTTATGKNVTHSWDAPGSYPVTLTVKNDEDSSTSTKIYTVVGDAVSKLSAVVVPWIARAEADKALPQSSDLDVHNPGTEPLVAELTFRQRGWPSDEPPSVRRTVAPGATLHVPDAMAELFGQSSMSGFLFVEPLEGDAQPVVTSTNRTFREDGQSFGQVVPGLPLSALTKSSGKGEPSHLVGLNANAERLAYFGISNPNDEPFRYDLRFYDSFGRLVGGTTDTAVIGRFGQKQYQSGELEGFGVVDLDDYRIEIVPDDGSPRPLVYGANLRRVSFDPSFVRSGRTDLSEIFLVGALNTPGLNDSLFRSDVVLGNTAAETVLCDLTFTPAGFQSESTSPIQEVLQPGESVRLADVVANWDVGEAVGAMRVVCDAPAGVFPVVQGESYDVSRPGEYYGQFMPALSVDDTARAGEAHTLVGLRRDAEHRTTVWLFNPSDEVVAEYTLRYFDAQGNEVGSEEGVRLGRSKFRQINPGAHPLPETMPAGFVVRVEVEAGQLLTAAQVVNQSNDPAYIVGQ